MPTPVRPAQAPDVQFAAQFAHTQSIPSPPAPHVGTQPGSHSHPHCPRPRVPPLSRSETPRTSGTCPRDVRKETTPTCRRDVWDLLDSELLQEGMDGHLHGSQGVSDALSLLSHTGGGFKPLKKAKCSESRAESVRSNLGGVKHGAAWRSMLRARMTF